MRATRKQVEGAFLRIAGARDWPVADDAWPIDDARRDGAVFLHYYNGTYTIRCYVPSSPQEGKPQSYTGEHVITRPLSGAAFIDAVGFAGEIREIG